MDEKERIRFRAKAMAVAKEELNASCEGDEARVFLNSVYEEYLSLESPPNAREWLRDRLCREFACVTDPPVWVEEEPSWPFFNGRPMVFIAQFTLPKTEVTEKLLTWDEVVYLFGARTDRPEGYEIVYKEVIQHPGIDGAGLR